MTRTKTDKAIAGGPTRRRHRKAAEPSAEVKPAPPPRFQFRRFAVLRAFFQEVPKVEPKAEAQPGAYSLQIGMSGSVALLTPSSAEVRIGVSVTPDPAIKPYQIQLEVLGVFGSDNATSEQLGEFCRAGAPSILFPYIRSVIDKLTADGRYGEVRLDPVNVGAILRPDRWQENPEVEKKPEPATP